MSQLHSITGDLNRSDFSLGVMQIATDERLTERFQELTSRARVRLAHSISQLALDFKVLSFDGPKITGPSGTADPLELLEAGISEKLERRLSFVLILTDAELTATRLSYSVAYASRLTNMSMISVRRLLPDFWGEDVDDETASSRLVALILHMLGHMLGLDHRSDISNYMFDFGSVQDLDHMSAFDITQGRALAENLPIEAYDETHRGSSLRFRLKQIRSNLGVIGSTLARANPVKLMSKLPTMLTAALSVVVVLFFSAETWDLASSVATYQIAVFTLIALLVSFFVLYRTFGFRSIVDRNHMISETLVVTQAATAFAVMGTVLTVFGLFSALAYLAAITIFPEPLMSIWASADPATETLDHVKLGCFLGAMAILTGSLGGRADSRPLVRTILFLDEET